MPHRAQGSTQVLSLMEPTRWASAKHRSAASLRTCSAIGMRRVSSLVYGTAALPDPAVRMTNVSRMTYERRGPLARPLLKCFCQPRRLCPSLTFFHLDPAKISEISGLALPDPNIASLHPFLNFFQAAQRIPPTPVLGAFANPIHSYTETKK